jgi:predicted S18 family serine protease
MKQEMCLSASTTHNKSSSYNPIFEKLVASQEENSQERLIGMLAYAEYKLDKHEWMSSNPSASASDLAAFLSHYNERVLSKYRIDAANILYGYAGPYAEEVLKEQLEKLKDEAISKDLKSIETRLTTEIEKTKISYMTPVWQSIIASAIFTLILFIVALIIRFSAPNSGIGQLIQYFLAPENYELRVIEKHKNTP